MSIVTFLRSFWRGGVRLGIILLAICLAIFRFADKFLNIGSKDYWLRP